MKKHSLRMLAFLLGCLLSLPLLAAVSASVDRSQLAQGESLQLTLQFNGSTDSEPELAPLKNDFDILGSGKGSNIQIVNGHVSEQVQVQVVLAPRHAGKLTIPALRWGREQTTPILINVAPAAAPPAQPSLPQQQSGGSATTAPSHVFLTEDLDNSEPYMQNAVVLMVRIFYDVPLYQANLDLAASADVLVQPLGKDQQSQAVRNGHTYQVAQRQYLLTPQHSGHLTLDGPVLDAEVAVGGVDDPFFGNIPFANMLAERRPIRLHGKPLDLDVRPPPTDAAGHVLLPVTQLTLDETWKPAAGSVRVGEPLTRHLHLHALGVSGSALPDLAALLALPDGIKAYPDQAKTETGQQGGEVTGSSDQDIALIASEPGRYTLPAIHLSWWDTTRNVQRDVSLPARTLEVLPGPATGAAPAAPVSGVASPPTGLLPSRQAVAVAGTPVGLWRTAALAMGGLWLLTVLAWILDRRRLRRGRVPAPPKPDKPVTAGMAMKAFRKACQQNAAVPARQHLLAWAQARWPEREPLPGLEALAQRLGDASLLPLFAELDRACYAGGRWQGAPLLAASKAWLGGGRKPAAGGLGLADLYD